MKRSNGTAGRGKIRSSCDPHKIVFNLNESEKLEVVVQLTPTRRMC